MSKLRIFPPIVTLYPLQRQLFTAQAVPGPAMWQAVTDSGDIKSDYSLEVDPAGSVTTGLGAHWLFSGIGTVAITIDDKCRPTSTGAIFLEGQVTDTVGALYQYTIVINTTTVKVLTEGSVEVYTESYSTISGDVFHVELFGGFRAYRNGVLMHSRLVLPTVVVYPIKYRCVISEPTAAAPTRIPQPVLTGDWRIGPVVEWAAPSHGAISYIGLAGSTEYHSGFTPGTYTLAARIESAADAGAVQATTATIIIPPLKILGPTNVVLQPGQKVRFKTNYPDHLITWSVVSGGGSFTQGEFTAGANPGSSVIRATATVNSQAANITVTVPAVVTGAFLAAVPSEQIDFNTNIAASTIPALFSGGSIVPGTGNLVFPAWPVGVQEGDLILLPVQTANQAVATPAGFAIVADSPQGIGTGGAAGATRLSLFWARWTPTLALPTITDPGDHAIAELLAARGCPISGDPWDVTAGNTVATTTAVSIPGDTTTVANCLVVGIVVNATDTAVPQVSGYVNASLTNIFEHVDFNAIDGVGGGFAIVSGVKLTAGAYSATTATLATSSAQGRMSVALKPGGVLWTASIGSINASSGLWTAPSLPGQTARITASDGFFTVIIEVPVLQAFPYEPSSRWVWDRKRNRLVSEAEDDTRTGRIKSANDTPFEDFEFQFLNRLEAELTAVLAFWDDHDTIKEWIFQDTPRAQRLVGFFDSDIHVERGGGCEIDYSFRFRGRRV